MRVRCSLPCRLGWHWLTDLEDKYSYQVVSVSRAQKPGFVAFRCLITLNILPRASLPLTLHDAFRTLSDSSTPLSSHLITPNLHFRRYFRQFICSRRRRFTRAITSQLLCGVLPFGRYLRLQNRDNLSFRVARPCILPAVPPSLLIWSHFWDARWHLPHLQRENLA